MSEESNAKKRVRLLAEINRLWRARLVEQINMFWQQGRYEESVPLAADFCELELRTSGSKSAGYASCLHILAELYRLQSKNDVAEHLFLQALEIYRVTLGERHSNYAKSLNSLGLLYHYGGNFQAAEPLFLQALDILRKTDGEEDPEYAASLHNLAALYADMGDFKAAQPLFHQAHAIARATLDERHPAYVTSLTSLANFYYIASNFQAAEPLFLQALDILRKTDGEKDSKFGAALLRLAMLYSEMGKYRAAEPLFLQALDIARADPGEQHPDYATILHNLAVLHHKIGNFQKAEPLFLQALEIRRKTLSEEDPKYGATLNHLAELYLAMDKYKSAVSLCCQALDVARKAFGEQHSDYGASINTLAKLYLSMGKYGAAEPLFLQALDIARADPGEQHPDYATSLHNLATLYLSVGNYDAAEPCFRQALDITRKTLGEQHPNHALYLTHLICLLAATDRAAEAFNLARQVASIYDEQIAQIFSTGSESQRLAYLEQIRDYTYLFLSLVQLCPHSETGVRAAMDLVLRRKAVGAEVLAVQRDAVLGGKYPALREQLSKLRTLTRQIAQKMLIGPGTERMDIHRQHLSKWNAERELLEADLARQIPEMSLERQLEEADHRALARALPKDTALIEFVWFRVYDFAAIRSRGESSWGPPRYLAFVLRAQEPDNIVMIDFGDAEQINHLIASFRMYIRNPYHSADDDIGAARVAEVGTDLCAIVFDPLIPHISSSTRLFIAPDGELTRLPFEVLTSGHGGNLIDSYHISYLSTGRDVLRFDRGTPHQSSAPVIIADPDFDLGSETVQENDSNSDFSISRLGRQGMSIGRYSLDLARILNGFEPLPGTAEEGKKIANALHVSAWLRGRALESPLKSTLSPRILHFATHGFFLANQQPNVTPPSESFSDVMLDRITIPGMENHMLRSGLVLAGVNTWLNGGVPPEEAEDGILTAEDVSGLDLLATDLVVLSACETGLGALHVSEGVYGLRRSFMLAGAKTLVMSLWEVPDEETKDLMTDFYAGILRGEPSADALRNAQLKIKAAYPNPYYWGAFICQGDPSPIHSL